MDSMEKAPLQSKKFVGYLVAEATWKVLIGILLVMGIHGNTIDVFLGSVALALIVVAGFIEAGYIIGQASLDKYVRVTEIAARNGNAIQMKGMNMTQTTTQKTPSTPEQNPPTNG